MTKIDLYQRVVINRDIPDEHVQHGDVGWLVDYVEHPTSDETGAVIEIMTVFGETVDVVIVPASAIEPLRADHVPSVREKSL